MVACVVRAVRWCRQSSVFLLESVKPEAIDPGGRLPRDVPLWVRDRRTGQRDCHLLQLSAELRRLGVSVAALAEVRKPGSGWAITKEWLWPSPTDRSL